MNACKSTAFFVLTSERDGVTSFACKGHALQLLDEAIQEYGKVAVDYCLDGTKMCDGVAK